MPWADASVIAAGNAGAPGTMSTSRVKGLNVALREGEGITTSYLDKHMTDGQPSKREVPVYVTYRRGEIDTKYEKTYVRPSGIQVQRYLNKLQDDSSATALEMQQRRGQLPYQNMQSMVYTLSAPIIMSNPVFFGSGEASLSQDDNGVQTSSSAGVNLYRTRDGYSQSAAVLSSPELVTLDTWKKYESHYTGFLEVEPATGASMEIYVVNQINSFTFNCNPSLDPTCGLLATSYNSADPLCYSNNAVQYPCSAANVFTPRALGGKVIPLLWMSVKPLAGGAESETNLAYILQLRYILGIMLLVLSLLSFIAIVVLWLVFFMKRNEKRGTTIVPS